MSKAFERAMSFLEETADMEEESAPVKKHTGPCWRCGRNKSRVPDQDYVCEACFQWLNGESDDDPTNAPRGWWGFPRGNIG